MECFDETLVNCCFRLTEELLEARRMNKEQAEVILDLLAQIRELTLPNSAIEILE